MSELIKKVREVSSYEIKDSPLGFNLVNDIEDYIKKLQQENTQLKQQLKDKDEKISKIFNYIKEDLSKCTEEFDKLNNYKDTSKQGWEFAMFTDRNIIIFINSLERNKEEQI